MIQKKPIYKNVTSLLFLGYIIAIAVVYLVILFKYPDKTLQNIGFLITALGLVLSIVSMYQSNYTSIRMKRIDIVIANENEIVNKDVLVEIMFLTEKDQQTIDKYHRKVVGILEVLISYGVEQKKLEGAKDYLTKNKDLESLIKISEKLLMRKAYFKSAALKTIDSQSQQERKDIEKKYFEDIEKLFDNNELRGIEGA